MAVEKGASVATVFVLVSAICLLGSTTAQTDVQEQSIPNISATEMRMKREVEPRGDGEPTFNYPPINRNLIDHIVAVIGEEFVYKIPSDIFYDFEDGDTRNLRLLFLTVDGLTPPLSLWVKFNKTIQTLYGIPSAEDIGQNEYMMVAIDKSGSIARNVFYIDVELRGDEEPTIN